jgi:hypothetical protein
MKGYVRSTEYFVSKLSKEISFSVRLHNNLFGLVNSLRDGRSGVWFPAGERDYFVFQIVHNSLVSTWSPVQGVPGVDSRWEERQAHDADQSYPCLHGLHENNFSFTPIEAAYSLLYCKFHVHFISPQNVYYTSIKMFITRNTCI